MEKERKVKKRGFFEGLFGKKHDKSSPSSDESEMIEGIRELGGTTVKEVLVPRIDTVFLPSVVLSSDLLKIMVDSGHSRYPVFQDTIDNVVGVLYLKDVVRYLYRQDFKLPDQVELVSLCRPAFFVPDSKRLDSLLAEFKRKRVHIAVALDEYGGVSGVVCMEDVIEIIIGDIQDEFDNEVEDIIVLNPTTFLCDARVSIEELNDRLNFNLPHTDFDTLGGYVFDLFGKIPVRFEKATSNGIEFIIQSMDGHKIKTIKIVKNDTYEE